MRNGRRSELKRGAGIRVAASWIDRGDGVGRRLAHTAGPGLPPAACPSPGSPTSPPAGSCHPSPKPEAQLLGARLGRGWSGRPSSHWGTLEMQSVALTDLIFLLLGPRPLRAARPSSRGCRRFRAAHGVCADLPRARRVEQLGGRPPRGPCGAPVLTKASCQRKMACRVDPGLPPAVAHPRDLHSPLCYTGLLYCAYPPPVRIGSSSSPKVRTNEAKCRKVVEQRTRRLPAAHSGSRARTESQSKNKQGPAPRSPSSNDLELGSYAACDGRRE